MTDTFTFQELREFIESRKDETKIDCTIPGALLSHYCAFKTGKLAEFAGYFMAKASSGDPWSPHVLFTTDLLVPQFISKIRYCTNFKEVKQLLDTPMELSTDQLYILEIANKTYANGEVNFDRAMQLANSMLKTIKKLFLFGMHAQVIKSRFMILRSIIMIFLPVITG